MNKTYLFLAALLILLGVGLVVLEGHPVKDEVTPRTLLREMNDNSRYITTDQLAKRIIDGDPSVQLIDVRDPYDFMDFALPGAKNIPLSDLLIDESNKILSQPGRDFIFYSTGDVYANQAWMLARRLGLKRLYVLKGGLNNWIKTIIQPTPPPATEPQEAFDLYNFRLGASQFFTGGKIEVKSVEPQDKIEFSRRKKKSAVEGGC